MNTVFDDSPTAQGFHWWCNGCVFNATAHADAVAHALSSRAWIFPHMLFERLTRDDPPKRRIALELNGEARTIRLERGPRTHN